MNNKTKHTYTEIAPVEFTNLPRIYLINFLGNNSYVLDFMNFYPIKRFYGPIYAGVCFRVTFFDF